MITILTNFFYAGISIVILLVAMAAGYKLLDKLTPFDTAKEIDEANTAVGIIVGCIFIALGLGVAILMGLALH